VLKAITASPYGQKTKERALLKVAPYLSSDQLRDLLLGRGPAGPAQCARALEEHLAGNKPNILLDPIIKKIQHDAVRSAGVKVVGGGGRINHKNRYAKDLVPALADLAVHELIRLKLVRFFRKLKQASGL
jgi:hypothetical protein